MGRCLLGWVVWVGYTFTPGGCAGDGSLGGTGGGGPTTLTRTCLMFGGHFNGKDGEVVKDVVDSMGFSTLLGSCWVSVGYLVWGMGSPLLVALGSIDQGAAETDAAKSG